MINSKYLIKLLFICAIIVQINTSTDKEERLCVDEKCEDIISLAKTVNNYSPNQANVLGFKINSEVKIKSKSSNSDFWGVEINGKDGYAPKRFLQEHKVYHRLSSLKPGTPKIAPPPNSGKKIKGSEKQKPQKLEKAAEEATTTATEPLVKDLENQKLVSKSNENQLESEKLLNVTPTANVVDGTAIPDEVELGAAEKKQEAVSIDTEEEEEDDEDEDEDDYEDDDEEVVAKIEKADNSTQSQDSIKETPPEQESKPENIVADSQDKKMEVETRDLTVDTEDDKLKNDGNSTQSTEAVEEEVKNEVDSPSPLADSVDKNPSSEQKVAENPEAGTTSLTNISDKLTVMNAEPASEEKNEEVTQFPDINKQPRMFKPGKQSQTQGEAIPNQPVAETQGQLTNPSIIANLPQPSSSENQFFNQPPIDSPTTNSNVHSFNTETASQPDVYQVPIVQDQAVVPNKIPSTQLPVAAPDAYKVPIVQNQAAVPNKIPSTQLPVQEQSTVLNNIPLTEQQQQHQMYHANPQTSFYSNPVAVPPAQLPSVPPIQGYNNVYSDVPVLNSVDPRLDLPVKDKPIQDVLQPGNVKKQRPQQLGTFPKEVDASKMNQQQEQQNLVQSPSFAQQINEDKVPTDLNNGLNLPASVQDHVLVQQNQPQILQKQYVLGQFPKEVSGSTHNPVQEQQDQSKVIEQPKYGQFPKEDQQPMVVPQTFEQQMTAAATQDQQPMAVPQTFEQQMTAAATQEHVPEQQNQQNVMQPQITITEQPDNALEVAASTQEQTLEQQNVEITKEQVPTEQPSLKDDNSQEQSSKELSESSETPTVNTAKQVVEEDQPIHQSAINTEQALLPLPPNNPDPAPVNEQNSITNDLSSETEDVTMPIPTTPEVEDPIPPPLDFYETTANPKSPPPPPPPHAQPQVGLFQTIYGTVKGFLPSIEQVPKEADFSDELDRILFPKKEVVHFESQQQEEEFCEKDVSCQSAESLIQHHDDPKDFFENLSQRIIELFDVLCCMLISATATLLFIFGYYCLSQCRKESQLIGKLNVVERSLLASHKEASILKHDLSETHDKLASIENNSFGSNDMVIAIRKELEICEEAKAKLEDQVLSLEKELENAAEAGLELNKIVSELLNNQSGDESIISSVEELQRQLNEQQHTILEINAVLADKSRENSELQLMLAEQNAKFVGEIASLQQDNDELEGEKNLLNSKLDEMKTEFDLDITKALEGKNAEIKRLQADIVELRAKCDEEHRKWQTSLAKIEALENCLKTVKRDPTVKVSQILDVANVQAELLDIQRQRTTLKEKLETEMDTRKLLEVQVKSFSDEIEKLKQDFHQSEKDKLEAQTRLEVLSNYFKEKENQLQKELSLKESMWLQQQGETTSTVDRLTNMQEEIQTLKSQNDALRAEIEAQLAAHKAQIGTLENRAHETWLAARQSERKYEEARSDATALRRKLTSLVGGTAQNISKENNLDLNVAATDPNNAPSPVHMDTPASPLLGRLPPPPPFMPPPFMGPPPHFMGIPPFLPPGEMRPPPMGRLMSPPPPPPGAPHMHRYSPIDDDYADDDIHDNGRGHWRDSYSPPRHSYRYSPDRYAYNPDMVSNYDTETDFSPPPSPREQRSHRSGSRSGSFKAYSPPPPQSTSSQIKDRPKKSNKGHISSGSEKSYGSWKGKSKAVV